LDLDAPDLKKCLQALKEIDFELAYLVLLTRQGLKPLSRWEKPFEDSLLKLLEKTGLLPARIRRTVKSGAEVAETIFSTSPGYIRLYQQHFADAPIDKSPATLRFEGYLFGFPACCVDQYISHPYAENDLQPDQQKILFHWACKGCKITPLLLPAYQAIYDKLSKDCG
jgi:hypothetical protein